MKLAQDPFVTNSTSWQKKKHKGKIAKQERSTGGGGEELSELESILEELIKIGKGERKAVEMRKRAMESMGETRDRDGESSKVEKIKRRSAWQSMDWPKKALK